VITPADPAVAPLEELPLEHLAALGRLVRVLNHDVDLQEAMRTALAAVLQVLDFDGGGIYLCDHDSRMATVRCAAGIPEDFLSEIVTVSMDEAPYRDLLVHGEPVFLEDYSQLSQERAARWGFASMAAVPLEYGGTVLGALNVISTRRRTLSAYERGVLELAGRELGSAFSRSRVAEDLRRAEDNLRTFFELSPDMLFVLDGQGDVVEMNREASRQLGYTSDEYRGRSVYGLHPASDRDRVANTVTRMLSGMEEVCTVPLLTSGGHEVPVETRVAQGTWNGADALFGICRNSRSDRVLRAAVGALNGALQLKDAYTASHVQGVTAVAVALAEEMGLPPDRVDLVRIAAELHDIGKLGVPPAVLSKPGQLSPAERLLIEEHSMNGYELLRPMDFLGPIPDIVAQHHERCDGSGYPNGLRADGILLEARVVAVADVVEAMASHRPYRPALPFSSALNEIRQGAGVTYDEDVAAALQELWKRDEIPLEAAHAAARHRRRAPREERGG
jgi:PAS domain S-box-containing protein/putative nucleotidyltransferase with HDIG domain